MYFRRPQRAIICARCHSSLGGKQPTWYPHHRGPQLSMVPRTARPEPRCAQSCNPCRCQKGYPAGGMGCLDMYAGSWCYRQGRQLLCSCSGHRKGRYSPSEGRHKRKRQLRGYHRRCRGRWNLLAHKPLHRGVRGRMRPYRGQCFGSLPGPYRSREGGCSIGST